MAVTYGNNLGSNARGAFALITVSASAPADTINILRLSAGVITAVTGGVSLTAGQLAALNATYSALASGAVDDLGVLSALVGVVSLDSASTVSLSMVGDVLTATCSAAGKVVVYIPNSAASGIVVGGQGTSGAGGRQEYVANVPGLYLQGVACLVAPNFGADVTIDPAQCGGFAQTAGATINRKFRVEKTTIVGAAAVGAGLPLFTVDFDVGSNVGQPNNFNPANYTIATNELIRIVNPSPADANLADVAITLVGYLPL